ncbi:hypothetical protein MWH28_08780 [Natroniella sulfidigena]|uniref:hypothetical protein n=1 Tax=Natroniella sulfidigena TaxID=723921 RepID=UPI00200A579D|nr:hypothetical protein [Natroniella sulfidigena]MCK8817452.1 hypothetical protein [Natroniella sulfidigena]
MNNNLLTINRYLDLNKFNSLHLIEELRLFVKKAKKINPQLEKYQLYDIGLIFRADLILIKLYFCN